MSVRAIAKNSEIPGVLNDAGSIYIPGGCLFGISEPSTMHVLQLPGHFLNAKVEPSCCSRCYRRIPQLRSPQLTNKALGVLTHKSINLEKYLEFLIFFKKWEVGPKIQQA